MKPWELLGETHTADGDTLTLRRQGREYVIMANGQSLMSSRMHGSEEALAALACRRLGTRTGPRVLVGGLGMDFTLRAALDLLPRDASVVVAELVPAVVEWNRGPLTSRMGLTLGLWHITMKRLANWNAPVHIMLRLPRKPWQSMQIKKQKDIATLPSN